MSGHNKWSKIKRQKEKTDAQKSKIFGKLLRMISVEAKMAQGNPSSPSLETKPNQMIPFPREFPDSHSLADISSPTLVEIKARTFHHQQTRHIPDKLMKLFYCQTACF